MCGIQYANLGPLAFECPHPHAFQAAAGAHWHGGQQFARWALEEALPGEVISFWLAFPVHAGVILQRNVVATILFQGPPDETLSGIALDSGVGTGRLQESRAMLAGTALATLM